MREIISENISKTAWDYLELFLDINRLKKQHVDSTKVRHINFCLQQAREYYEASANASLKTKPVLLYYGMLNLVKALILLRNKSVTLDSNLSSHGLRRKSYTNKRSLLSLACTTATNEPKSVFTNLLKTTSRDFSKFPLISDGVSIVRQTASDYSSTQQRILGQKFISAELLVLVPELFDILIETQKLTPVTVPIIHLSSTIKTEGNKQIISRARITLRHSRNTKLRAMIKRNEKKILAPFKIVKDYLDAIDCEMPKPIEIERFSCPRLRNSLYRENYALFFAKKKQLISETPAHYLLMFILGDVARYKPDVWMRLLQSNLSEAKLVDRFIEVSAIKFPLLVLREICDELVEFKAA